MLFFNSIAPLLLLAAGAASAASSWSFEDGSVIVSNKKSGAEPVKETYVFLRECHSGAPTCVLGVDLLTGFCLNKIV